MWRGSLTLLALFTVAASAQVVCPPFVDAVSGSRFDISGLAAQPPFKTRDASGIEFWLKVCSPLPQAAPVPTNCQQLTKPAFCVSSTTSSLAVSLGTWDGTPAPTWGLLDSSNPGAGVQVVFRNAPVQNAQQPVANLRVQCGPASDTLTTSGSGLTYSFAITSPLGCPVLPSSEDGGLSGGSIFVIILVVLIPIYIVGGCLWSHFRKGTPFGRESCPCEGFWCATPGLFRDGCGFFFRKVTSCCRKDAAGGGGGGGSGSGGGGYEQF